MAKKKPKSKPARKRIAKKVSRKNAKRQTKKVSPKNTAKKRLKKSAQKRRTKKSSPNADMGMGADLGTAKVAVLGRCEWRYEGNVYCDDGISIRECERKAVTYPGATIIGFFPGQNCPD